MKNKNSFYLLLVVFVSCILYSSCSKNEQTIEKNQGVDPTDQVLLESRSSRFSNDFYALTDVNSIVLYSGDQPIKAFSTQTISGLQTGERILAIDFRPATGQLYGVSNQSRLFTINIKTGVASAVTIEPFTPAIIGDEVGLDFNPTVDRIRLVTSKGQNLRLNPESGKVAAIDVNINPATATLSSAAYTNSMAGASTTSLYDIDGTSKKLFLQTPPNDGTLKEVGSLGVTFSGESGFDISPDNSRAIAALFGSASASESDHQYRFYMINLTTGAAQFIGNAAKKILGIAIPTAPVAYAVDDLNRLMIFNPFNKSTIVTKSIVGLQPNEKLLGLDMRPATAQLYALGSSSRLYTINMATGAATAVGTEPFTTLLQGTSFGFDFNPTVDRIRVVSNSGQNLRLHPVTGAIAAVDPSLNPGAPSVDAVAYINNTSGATTTILYDIDYKQDRLYRQDPANAGTLINVGYMGINADASNGFDIGGQSNKGYGLFDYYGSNYVFEINLNVGKADLLRAIPNKVNGFAIGLGF